MVPIPEKWNLLPAAVSSHQQIIAHLPLVLLGRTLGLDGDTLRTRVLLPSEPPSQRLRSRTSAPCRYLDPFFALVLRS